MEDSDSKQQLRPSCFGDYEVLKTINDEQHFAVYEVRKKGSTDVSLII